MNNKLILGTVQFGLDYGINNIHGKPSAKQVFEIIDYAHKKGIKILDTADAYGNANELLGKFNEVNPEKFFVNTKFKKSQVPIHRQLDTALTLLNINQINTYFYHTFNDFVNYPDLLNELDALKKESKIKEIGLSVYDNEEFNVAIENKLIDVIQLPFNLLDNFSQRGELLSKAKENSKMIQARSVFLQGLFFKHLNNIPPNLIPLKKYLQQIRSIAVKSNIPMEQLALQYALQQKEIDNVIIGVDNLEQLKRNLNFVQTSLPYEIIESINKINVKETELLYPKNWN